MVRRLAPALVCTLLASVTPDVAAADEPAWVFFTDRGRDEAATAAAIGERAAELSPRALARRRRVRGDGGVDVRDLSPAPGHVAAVLATGARLRRSSRWLNAISVEASAGQRAAIAALPGVRRVQAVARGRRAFAEVTGLGAPATAADDATYGLAWTQLDMLQVPQLHDCGLTGAGVVIGVQDSGFSLDHQALAGIDVIAAHDFVDDDDDVGHEPGDDPNQFTHGTMVLSLIAGADPGAYMGAAPGASVILSKTEDITVEAPFEEDNFVAGLEWIESMGADIFTASLGYIDWYEPADLDGATAVTTIAAEIAVAQGLIVFNAIGNSGPGPTTMGVPADAEAVLSIGAVDLDGLVSSFSSRGPTADGRIKPNLVAPGRDVVVAHPFDPAGYLAGKGTSFAGPLAAGTAALLVEALPGVTPAELRAMLQGAGDNADAPNNDVGWGLPAAFAPVARLCNCGDADGDGADAASCGGDDCDDADPEIHPGAQELCNGRDDDCDGALPSDEVDGDGDGTPMCNDCDEGADDPACAGGTASGGDASDTGAVPTSGGDAPDSGADEPADDADAAGCACGTAGAPWFAAPVLLARRRRRHQPR